MKRLQIAAVLAGVVVAFILVGILSQPATAAWKAAAWNYNTSDLYGANCIQTAVDDLDTRLDAAAATLTAATIVRGTVTNGQAVAFATPFTATPVVFLTQLSTVVVAYASAVTSNGFTAVIEGGTTNGYLAIGPR